MRGFIPHSTEDGHIPAWQKLPCGAITPKIGMALYQSSGNLAIATGTTKPTYICMEDHDSAVSAGTLINVIKVTEDIIFDVTFSASASDIKTGDLVTLHGSNGLQVTATTASGVFKIVEKMGSASGDHCLGRF